MIGCGGISSRCDGSAVDCYATVPAVDAMPAFGVGRDGAAVDCYGSARAVDAIPNVIVLGRNGAAVDDYVAAAVDTIPTTTGAFGLNNATIDCQALAGHDGLAFSGSAVGGDAHFAAVDRECARGAKGVIVTAADNRHSAHSRACALGVNGDAASAVGMDALGDFQILVVAENHLHILIRSNSDAVSFVVGTDAHITTDDVPTGFPCGGA